MSDPLNQQIALIACRRMLKSYFDITAYRRCSTLLHYWPDAETLNRLETLHCVSFNEMTPAIREFVVQELCNLIGGPVEEETKIESNLPAKRKHRFFG